MALVNADPQTRSAGRGWRGDFGLVIEAEAPSSDVSVHEYRRLWP